MTGVVVSASGIGGVTINIPIQFSVFTVNTRVITDGFTAANIADAIEIPDALAEAVVAQADALAEGATSMLGNIMPTDCQAYDAATNAWSTLSDVDPMTALDTAQTAINSKMQGFITSCTASANMTMRASMNQLIDIGASGSFADIAAAAAANPHHNPEMGGVQQAAQQLQKFNDIANEMSSTSSELGGAIAAVKSISKNGMMLSAMGSLASGIASKCGLPAPPSMEDAFATIADGTCGQALNVLNSGMSAVNSIAQLPPYSGHLDDMNEVVWQGLTFGTTGINLPFLGGGTLEGGSVTTIPAPAWVNPNPHLGSTTGSFPAGKSIGEAFMSMYYLDRACKLQIDLLNSKQDIIKPSENLLEFAAVQYDDPNYQLGKHEWPALKRMLDKNNSIYDQ